MALSRAMIDKSAVRAIATVDRKKNEMAFLALAKEWDVELWSFTPEELESAGTKFAESPFVRKTVGVGNVCERAAVMGVRRIYREREMDEKNLPAIDLRVQKMAFNGVTAAVAVPASEQVRRQQWKKKIIRDRNWTGGERTDDGPGRPHFAGKPGDHRLYGIRGPGKRILSTGGISDNADAPGKGTL